jgi:hypothetical protein
VTVEIGGFWYNSSEAISVPGDQAIFIQENILVNIIPLGFQADPYAAILLGIIILEAYFSVQDSILCKTSIGEIAGGGKRCLQEPDASSVQCF